MGGLFGLVVVVSFVSVVNGFIMASHTCGNHGVTELQMNSNEKSKTKRLVLIRHGRTFMNEYLSTPGSKWGDENFTDIFTKEENEEYYRDSPLTMLGQNQAKQLLVSANKEEGEESTSTIWNNVDLVVTSPLTRTLQTMELGVLPMIVKKETTTTPIVALPLASERIYLISDIGTDTNILSTQFPMVDFTSEFHSSINWWESKDDEEEEYVEWRPFDKNQTYACKGETPTQFQKRMMALYDWLDQRPESTIVLISHWGVIRYLVGDEFENCEMRTYNFYTQVKRDGYKKN